jgi:hypothetical protein
MALFVYWKLSMIMLTVVPVIIFTSHLFTKVCIITIMMVNILSGLFFMTVHRQWRNQRVEYVLQSGTNRRGSFWFHSYCSVSQWWKVRTKTVVVMRIHPMSLGWSNSNQKDFFTRSCCYFAIENNCLYRCSTDISHAASIYVGERKIDEHMRKQGERIKRINWKERRNRQ